jgi:hypothetical protein
MASNGRVELHASADAAIVFQIGKASDIAGSGVLQTINLTDLLGRPFSEADCEMSIRKKDQSMRLTMDFPDVRT